MEMLIFLNGILFAFNALFLIKSGRKQVRVAPAETSEDKNDNLPTIDQIANMMTYNGTAQGGAHDEN